MISAQERSNLEQLIAKLLFTRGLDLRASFRVCERGVVVLKFANSIPYEECSLVMRRLREIPLVEGVYAEQGGAELQCPPE